MIKDGFVKLDHLLEHRSLKNSNKEELLKIVENCSKQRFLVEYFTNEQNGSSEPWIRANQGHSLKNIQVEMTEITESEKISECVHGTYYKAWEMIKKTVRIFSKSLK